MLERMGLAVTMAIGCTPSPDPSPSSSAPPSATAPAPAAPSADPDADPTPAATPPAVNDDGQAVSDLVAAPIADCKIAIEEYLHERAALDRCERDSDCAEIWPGLCPHGPFYIHREADLAPVQLLARRIEAHCTIPECEPPMELGIARCEKGKCVAGRRAPEGAEPCWDVRESHLEPGGAAQSRTVAKIVGTTPHIVIAPAKPGSLRLRVQWPRDCGDCKLLVSEHGSGMAALVDTTPKSSTDLERNGQPMREDTIELSVTPGPYHMVGTSATPVDFLVRAELRRTDGATGRVTRHGEGWTRMCED